MGTIKPARTAQNSLFSLSRSISIATIAYIKSDRLLGNFPLRLPSVGEQQQILKGITESTGSLHQAIDRASREISLLREYRTRLIADVVTGKLDVRAAAANLPDESDEPEALDDTVALAESAEDTADGDLDAAPEETEA